jgi:uncharacterized lipoprotein NlpE involved in copper resistance
MRFGLLLGLVALLVGLSGCAKNPVPSHAPDPAHTSQHALDWEGSYQGTIPSASGSGIRLHVKITSLQAYAVETLYLDKSPTLYTSHGSFVWDEKGQIISFEQDPGVHFFVGENVLILLDQSGQFITGPLEEMYRLHKLHPPKETP